MTNIEAPTPDSLAASPPGEPSIATLIVPALVSAKLGGKRFAVIGCETAEAVRVVAAFTAANASAWVVTVPPEGASPNFFASYDGCILRAIPSPGWGYVSAAELAAELPFLDVAQGEAKVREVLREAGPFAEVWRGSC